MLDRKFWNKEGPIVRDKYRKHIFAKAKDVNSRSFKGYTTEYGTRKRATKLKRQASKYSGTLAPVLTSDLLRDFGIMRTTSDGFQMGWAVWGAKIKWLKDMGRRLSTSDQPMPNKLIEYLRKNTSGYIKKKMPKGKKIYKLGK